jgi:hypothetical protein
MDFHSEWQLGPARFHTPSTNRLEFTALRIAGKCSKKIERIEGCGSKVTAFQPHRSLFSFYYFTNSQNVVMYGS